jgi:hypothetical protein
VQITVKDIVIYPGETFYTGKGCGRRMFHHRKPSQRKHNALKTAAIDRIEAQGATYIPIIMQDNLTNKQAMRLERKLIKKRGRIIMKTGKLTNLTEGGEGADGYRHTDELKKHWSKIRKGRPSGKKGVKRPGIGGRPKGTKWTSEQHIERAELMKSEEYKTKNKLIIEKRIAALVDYTKTHTMHGSAGKIWINNGIKEKYILAQSELPAGFVIGRLPFSKDANRRGFAWITDGIKSRRTQDIENIPEGWRRGRIL